jgi:hypothetical protein
VLARERIDQLGPEPYHIELEVWAGVFEIVIQPGWVPKQRSAAHQNATMPHAEDGSSPDEEIELRFVVKWAGRL